MMRIAHPKVEDVAAADYIGIPVVAYAALRENPIQALATVEAATVDEHRPDMVLIDFDIPKVHQGVTTSIDYVDGKPARVCLVPKPRVVPG